MIYGEGNTAPEDHATLLRMATDELVGFVDYFDTVVDSTLMDAEEMLLELIKLNGELPARPPSTQEWVG